MDIHKTNVNIIRQQSFDLISYLDTVKEVKMDILQEKFNELFTTSPTLFNYILKNYSITRNNKEKETQFKQNLDMLLSSVKDVQNGKMTQTQASGKVGVHLAHTFIPNFKDLR
jgi:hypothetical protein